MIAETPLPVLKDYLWARTLDDAAPCAGEGVRRCEFRLSRHRAGRHAADPRARWKRGVALVKNAMGEAVGEQYVARYFPPEAKAEADKLVKNVIRAMDDRLANLTWMAPETKVKARAKLAAFRPQIGYPDEVARLFGAEDRARRPVRQRAARRPASNGIASSASSASRPIATNGS